MWRTIFLSRVTDAQKAYLAHSALVNTVQYSAYKKYHRLHWATVTVQFIEWTKCKNGIILLNPPHIQANIRVKIFNINPVPFVRGLLVMNF